MGEELTNIFQQLVGLLLWTIKLVRVDILQRLVFYLDTCVPQERDASMLSIVYLDIYRKKVSNNSGRMTYDPIYELTDENVFEVAGQYLE